MVFWSGSGEILPREAIGIARRALPVSTPRALAYYHRIRTDNVGGNGVKYAKIWPLLGKMIKRQWEPCSTLRGLECWLNGVFYESQVRTINKMVFFKIKWNYFNLKNISETIRNIVNYLSIAITNAVFSFLVYCLILKPCEEKNNKLRACGPSFIILSSQGFQIRQYTLKENSAFLIA